MTDRIHNFSAGPATLPEPVLRKAQEATWNVAGSGIGIMEHSHRGKVFDRIIAEAEEACRSLAGIPDEYRVLFLQGGASLQFAMIPMNLLGSDRTADYLVTGVWSQKAVKEAKPIGKIHIAATGEATNFDRIPKPQEIRYSPNPVYVHITTNNTIYRTQAAEGSLYNTPPTFGIYVMGEVFKWIQSQGGLEAMAEHNEAKARLLYDYLDSSDFFRGTAQPDSRSLMNVCFRGPSEELEAKFISEATKRGLDGLKGHRSVGGMRASIYNACSRESVQALLSFMQEFERAN